MKIIIDAMGGDNAPLEIVKGALLGMEHWGVEVLLTGDTEAILRALRDCGHDTIPHGMEIVHTTETVDMCDDPSKVFRHKKDTSMGVGLTLLRDGKADALVSAGSTGALLAGATLITKRIRGIRRAAMAPVIPTTGGRAVLIDCGANAECTPEYLLQFAYLGSFYAGRVLGLERPRVGLLNIGTEDSKGTDLQKADGGLGSFLHEVVCPGLTGLLVVNLLVQRLGGVQAKQGQIAAIVVGIVIDVVDVVIVQLCVAQLMLAHGCGDGVALVDTTGLHRTADTCPNGNGNQRNKHDHKADAVELYFFCFLLLKNLTFGQLLGAFRMKLLLFGCTHEIISSHCSLLRI